MTNEDKQALRRAQARATTLEELERIAYLWNLKKGWAWHVWKGKQKAKTLCEEGFTKKQERIKTK